MLKLCSSLRSSFLATQSSLVLKIQPGGTDLRRGPLLGQGPPSHDFDLPFIFPNFIFRIPCINRTPHCAPTPCINRTHHFAPTSHHY
jgi:hypothetical protein